MTISGLTSCCPGPHQEYFNCFYNTDEYFCNRFLKCLIIFGATTKENVHSHSLISLICPHEKNFASLAVQNAFSEDSDPTAQICKIIWIFAGANMSESMFLTLRLVFYSGRCNLRLHFTTICVINLLLNIVLVHVIATTISKIQLHWIMDDIVFCLFPFKVNWHCKMNNVM